MAINDFNIGFLGKLDGTRSKNQINQDIEALKKSLNSLEIKATLDPKQSQALTKQLNLIQVSLSDASFSQQALNNLVSQVNNALKGIQINVPNINTSTAGKSATQAGQQIGQQIQNGINSIVQKGNFAQAIQIGNPLNTGGADVSFKNLTNEVETYFKTLSQTATVTEKLGDTKGIDSFIVECKNADGVVERLNYKLNETKDAFMYQGGTINDSPVLKQFQQMEKAATDYQNKLDTLKTKYANLNVDYSGFESVLASFKNGTADANQLSTAFNTLNNSITTSLNSLKSQASSFDQVQQALNNMRDLPSMIQTLETNMSGLADKTSLAGVDVQNLKNIYATLLSEMNANGGKVPTTDAWIQSYKDLMSTVAGTTKQVEALKKAEASLGTSIKLASDKSKLTLSNSIQTWMQNNSKASKQFGIQIDALVNKLRTADDLTVPELDKIRAEFTQIKISAREANKIGFSFGDKLKNAWQKFGGWTLVTGSMMKGLQELKDGVRFVANLDDALVNINYTMDVTVGQLSDIGNASIDMAKDLKTNATNVLDAVKTYANANETAESILNKSKPAIMMSNVTGIGTEDTVDILQGTLEQFDLAEEATEKVSDILQKVSQNMPMDFAKGVKEIASAIQASGNVAKDANMSLEQYSSLIGAIISKTRQSGSEVGRSVRTIMLRTTSASKLGVANGEVSQDDISNAEKSLHSAGINVRKDKDTFRDFNDILGDLYKNIDKISQVDLAKISYDMAGIRQTSTFKMMIKAYGDYLNLTKEAENAAGTTEENQEKYANSIKAKMQDLEATGQSVWNNILNSDVLKGGIDTLSDLLSIIDKLTSSFGALGLVIPTAGIIGFTAFIKNLD